MAITDQGGILRQAIYERLSGETQADVVYDLGFGWQDTSTGGRELGYLVMFKSQSPVPDEQPLVHTCTLIGHTPTDSDVRDIVLTALSVLAEKATRRLTG